MASTTTKKKKYALTNSYFKYRDFKLPDTILGVAQYQKEHGELPFEYNGDNWVYDATIEKQKRNGVWHQQFLTPTDTANRIAELAAHHASDSLVIVDACCGSGQLTRALLEMLPKHQVQGFDISYDMVETSKLVFEGQNAVFTEMCFKETNLPEPVDLIVANPPYEVKDVETFFGWLHTNLNDNGTAVLLLPKGMMEKDKPKQLVANRGKFIEMHREHMSEPFVHTKINAEIVVLEKGVNHGA